jgi:lipopolysaccharide/colanic/teichoic acid biosynthesis glycosyltransferase
MTPQRLLDLAIAGPLVLLTAPVIGVLALLIRLESPGHPIYTQTRVGRDGELFSIYKLRTMVRGAEFTGAGLAIQEGDERITRIGAFLRRYSLDELPNLWNVLRGEMSIVGPRPERPEFMEQLESGVPFWAHRHLLKPGITGWAQIRAGYAADELGANEKLSYDLWYLRHHTTMLDLLICLKTLPRMATRGGAR